MNKGFVMGVVKAVALVIVLVAIAFVGWSIVSSFSSILPGA